MARYNTTDLKWTDDGDLALDANNDLATVTGDDLLEQNIKIPLKIVNPDWESDPIGADMEDLIGMDNTRETAELGKNKIRQAFTRTGFFNDGDIWIDAKPTGPKSMMFFVFINSPFSSTPLIYEVDLDLGFGSTTRRIG